MRNAERIAKLDSTEYQKIFGVKQKTFEKKLQILKEEHKQRHLKGGRPGKLSVLDKLVIMLLCYYREYRVMENIAFDYGVSKSTICDSIRWVEDTLIKSGQFNLPSRKELTKGDGIEVVLIDATECEIERPPKKQKEYYSGKKKKHTLKLQIVANAATMDILSIVISKGKK